MKQEYASSSQIHLMFWGNGVLGNHFYNADGTPKQADVYFDVAAWAAFPNEASARAYDLSKHALAE